MSQSTHSEPLPLASLNQLFYHARTMRQWLPKDISPETIHKLYELTALGPTSSNTCPGRFVFITSAEAKAKLLKGVDSGNHGRTASAPLNVIIAQDMRFYDKMEILRPGENAHLWFEGKEEAIRETASRNSTLQGAYLIMAARSLGLDCGPMSGFDATVINQLFFEGTSWRANFLCNIGYGDYSQIPKRQPRMPFAQACQLL